MIEQQPSGVTFKKFIQQFSIKDLRTVGLDSPFTYQEFMNLELVDFFRSTLSAIPRIPLYFPPERVEYRGNWFFQNDANACTVYSVVNAMQALGVDLSATSKTDLVKNSWVDKSDYMAMILWFGKAAKIINAQYQEMEMRRLQLEDNLFTTTPMFWERILKVTSEESNRELLRKNVNTLKRVIKPGQVMLSGIIFSDYYEVLEKGRHAIVIAGYRIGKDGVTDVQVIDSNVGVIWVSLEHLSKSISTRPYPYIIRRK